MAALCPLRVGRLALLYEVNDLRVVGRLSVSGELLVKV